MNPKTQNIRLFVNNNERYWAKISLSIVFLLFFSTIVAIGNTAQNNISITYQNSIGSYSNSIGSYQNSIGSYFDNNTSNYNTDTIYQHLNEYINIAVKTSSTIASQNSEIVANEEQIKGQTALENPELSLSVLPKPMMNVNGEQVATISLMQMFPWPGVLSQKRKQMSCMTNSLEHKKVLLQNRIALQVQTSYYEMQKIQEKIKIFVSKREIFHSMIDELLYKYKTSSPQSTAPSQIPDLINLQLQEKEIDLQIKIQTEELKTKQQQFNILLHRPSSLAIILDTIVEKRINIDAFTWEQIEKSSPELWLLNAQQDASIHSIQMQKLSSLPSFALGVEYMINKQTSMPKMEEMNGKNMFMFMFKVSLPINRKKFSSNISEAKHRNLSLNKDYEQKREDILSEFLSLKQSYQNEQQKKQLYEQQLELLEQNIKILQTAYANSQATISDLLLIEDKLFDLRLKIVDSVTEINKIIAQLQTMIANYE